MYIIPDMQQHDAERMQHVKRQRRLKEIWRFPQNKGGYSSLSFGQCYASEVILEATREKILDYNYENMK